MSASLRAEYRLTSGAAHREEELNNRAEMTIFASGFAENVTNFINKSRYINKRGLNDNYYH